MGSRAWVAFKSGRGMALQLHLSTGGVPAAVKGPEGLGSLKPELRNKPTMKRVQKMPNVTRTLVEKIGDDMAPILVSKKL